MKSITQRRIFSLLLSLAMLIGLLPALGSIASAAGSGTTEGDPRIVTTYAELSSALSSGVTYVKLGANINTKDFNDGAGYTKSIQQTGTVQLDLDGYSVTFFSRTSPLPAAIRVTGDLSVKDSRGGGKLYIDANPNTASSKQVLILAETGSFRSACRNFGCASMNLPRISVSMAPTARRSSRGKAGLPSGRQRRSTTCLRRSWRRSWNRCVRC